MASERSISHSVFHRGCVPSFLFTDWFLLLPRPFWKEMGLLRTVHTSLQDIRGSSPVFIWRILGMAQVPSPSQSSGLRTHLVGRGGSSEKGSPRRTVPWILS